MIEELAAATGKYLLYRQAMDEVGAEDIPLFLAVPEAVYEGILSERIGILLRDRVHMKLCVFDPVQMEVARWIT